MWIISNQDNRAIDMAYVAQMNTTSDGCLWLSQYVDMEHKPCSIAKYRKEDDAKLVLRDIIDAFENNESIYRCPDIWDERFEQNIIYNTSQESKFRGTKSKTRQKARATRH